MDRGGLLSDPRYDAVRAIVMAVMDDDEEVPDGEWLLLLLVLLLLRSKSCCSRRQPCSWASLQLVRAQKAINEAVTAAAPPLRLPLNLCLRRLCLPSFYTCPWKWCQDSDRVCPRSVQANSPLGS